jgi:hypothetical protein
MTDVKTGGIIHFAFMNKASIWVIQALDQALAALPTKTTLPMSSKSITPPSVRSSGISVRN